MSENGKSIEVSDFGRAEEVVRVVRYIGGGKIRELMESDQYIEAFTHTQLGIEKILWDQIVGIFEGEQAMIVRRRVEESRKNDDRYNTGTAELIKWAHFLGAIDDTEFSDLVDFNKKRNGIIHGHGQWWHSRMYREALQKGIRFLERNGL